MVLQATIMVLQATAMVVQATAMVLLPLLHQHKVDTLTKEIVFTQSLLALKLVGVEKVANNPVLLNQVLLNQVAKVDGLANHHPHQVQMAVALNQELKLVNEFALVGLPEKLADKNATLKDKLVITMEAHLILPGHIELATLDWSHETSSDEAGISESWFGRGCRKAVHWMLGKKEQGCFFVFSFLKGKSFNYAVN